MIENTISIDSTTSQENSFAENFSETKVQNINVVQQDDRCGCDDSKTQQAEVTADKTETDCTADRPEQTVELTVYGEKLNVPLSQAIAQAQKGLAFDRMKSQLADAKNDYRLKALEAVAQQSGKSTWQLLGDIQHQTVAADFIARYGSFDAVPLEELGQAVNTLTACRKNLAQGEMQSRSNSISDQIADFILANPGCREIPDEVIAAAQKGENLSLAYSRINGSRLTKEIEEAKRELEILKGENKAAQNSTPSAKNAMASDKPKENEILKLMKSTW